MSKTDHSKYNRHKNKDPKAGRRQRQILSQALAREDYDSLPTQMSVWEIRTYESI